jgi:murein DD-endopeptidase MepM/ murein hydrolase activator NlpD
VLTAGWLYGGYGQSVMIDHGDGTLTHYAHTSRVLVRPGEAVAPGRPSRLEGSTGNSSGPHLHFEVHAGLWHQVDPAGWLRDHGRPDRLLTPPVAAHDHGRRVTS